MATPETRIRELNITLPEPPKPMAKYKPTVQVGNISQKLAHPAAESLSINELSNSVQPGLDACSIRQRCQQRLLQKSGTHRCHRTVEEKQQ